MVALVLHSLVLEIRLGGLSSKNLISKFSSSKYSLTSLNVYRYLGTGGLLIVYGKSVINNRNFISTGSDGLGTTYVTDGSSGGGSINIFYQDNYTPGTIDVSGGEASAESTGNGTCYGGAGGNGSISSGCIATGTYVAD